MADTLDAGTDWNSELEVAGLSDAEAAIGCDFHASQ
jgi:hypothetical protein